MMTDLYELVQKEAHARGSLYDGGREARAALLALMDSHGWFGQVPVFDKEKVLLADPAPLLPFLPLWLEAYGKGTEEKLRILLERCSRKLPDTCAALRDFLDRRGAPGKEAALSMADQALFSLKKEARDLKAEDIEEVLSAAAGRLGRTSFFLLQDFLLTMMPEGSFFPWRYSIDVRPRDPDLNGAYPVHDFARMAWACWNEEAWKERSLKEKALKNPVHARLWLFTAMHFICALRAADLMRLPAPSCPDALARKAPDDREAARLLAGSWLDQVRSLHLVPGKTARFGDVPEINLTVPESLLAPLGTILACALLSRGEGSPFIISGASCSSLSAFFGPDFAAWAGSRSLSSRRCNKSYLQGIEALSGDTGTAGAGYILAALARSHKGGIGTLPEATDIYLRDASFTGCTPEYVVRHMFERGTFGFTAVLLLEGYDRKAFRALSVRGQTELIRGIGLSALEIEETAKAADAALGRAAQAVSAFYSVCGDDPGAASGALKKLAFGAAPSKTDGLQCLAMACGSHCPSPDRSSCAGCGHEVYSRAFLHVVMKEYVSLCRRQAMAPTQEERERTSRLIRQGVLPVIGQYLRTLREDFPDADMAYITEMIRKGKNDASLYKDRSHGRLHQDDGTDGSH